MKGRRQSRNLASCTKHAVLLGIPSGMRIPGQWLEATLSRRIARDLPCDYHKRKERQVFGVLTGCKVVKSVGPFDFGENVRAMELGNVRFIAG
jgi:hypothetical protein